MNDRQFFKLNATYQVAPGTTADQLLDDAACLMSAVHDGLRVLAMNIDTNRDGGDVTSHTGFCQLLYGLSYLAEMGTNAAGGAHMVMMTTKREAKS